MKLYQLRKIKQLLYIVMGLMSIIIFRLFTMPISISQPQVDRQIVVETDTVWNTNMDTFQMNTTSYETVYLTKKDTVYLSTSLKDVPVKLYKDTLKSEDVTIYSQQYINGNLIDGVLSYELNSPKVVNTILVKESRPMVNHDLYAFGELGGNADSPIKASIGLLYTHQSKWMISYKMGLSPIYKPTHHIGVGYRVL
mgnify:CR=1 FL=1